MITVYVVIIIAIIVFATVTGGKTDYPLLKNRLPDSKLWKFDDIDVTITAAYLEIIAGAFFIDKEDIFKLHPEDSLENLYRSYYKNNRWGADDMELEICALKYESLCQTADIEFAYQSSIYDQLKTIAQYRNNQPVSTDECTYLLDIKMIFLPMLKSDAVTQSE